jgi:hypothetical protein
LRSGLAQLLKVPFRKTVGWVLLGILLSASLRLTWWAMELVYEPQVPQWAPAINAAYIINRLAWAFSTLTFILLLAGWMEAVHSKYPPPSDRFVTGVKVALIIVSILIMVVTLVVLIIAFTLCATASQGVYANTCTPIYNGHILTIAGFQVVIALGFLIYGIILLVRIRKASAANGTRSAKQIAVFTKIIVVTSTFFVCFSLRAVMLLYRPATGQFLPLGVFYAFAYIVPDFVPPIVQMFVLISTSWTAGRSASSTTGTAATTHATAASGDYVEAPEDTPLMHK